MNQLPAYLQNLPVSGLAARAAEGIGSALPPHISIRGNQFTMVDAAGAKQTAQTTFLDVCIADISDVMCKQYYDGDWTPDASDPPACWSANGIAPSIEAISPQSERCDLCQWNRRGSDVAMDGKTQIKACRDEKWLAVLVPGVLIPLQLKITPGSFKNWRGYIEKFKGQSIDVCHVLTRLTFEQNKNGVLMFAATGYIDQPTAEMYTKVKALKASDVLVGRNDRPRQGALAAPAKVGEIAQMVVLPSNSTAEQVATAFADVRSQAQPQGFQPAPFGNAASAVAVTTAQPVGAPITAQPEQPARRRRRTAEQIAADNAAATAGGQAQAFPQVQTAPFAQAAPAPAFGAPAPAAGGALFGIATNALPPPAGLDEALNNLFKGQ